MYESNVGIVFRYMDVFWIFVEIELETVKMKTGVSL